MAINNYLVEGVSGAGKSSACDELRDRGFAVVDGGNELAYQGDPETGEPTDGHSPQNHIWDENRVRALAADDDWEDLFFCGGSRNFDKFIDIFDKVFVLEVDQATIVERLDQRREGA
jgi:broad-specificity NMP kinase